MSFDGSRLFWRMTTNEYLFFFFCATDYAKSGFGSYRIPYALRYFCKWLDRCSQCHCHLRFYPFHERKSRYYYVCRIQLFGRSYHDHD